MDIQVVLVVQGQLVIQTEQVVIQILIVVQEMKVMKGGMLKCGVYLILLMRKWLFTLQIGTGEQMKIMGLYL